MGSNQQTFDFTNRGCTTLETCNRKAIMATPKVSKPSFNRVSLPKTVSQNFTQDEVRRLNMRFQKLGKDGSGSLSVNELMQLPNVNNNPLMHRIIEILDTGGDGEINFDEFIHGLSQLSVKGDKQSKLKFSFQIYDMDKDGYISNSELYQVLRMMVGD